MYIYFQDKVTYGFDANTPDIERYFYLVPSTGELLLVNTLPPKQTRFEVSFNLKLTDKNLHR